VPTYCPSGGGGGRAEPEENPEQKESELPAPTSQQPELYIQQAAGAQAASELKESPDGGDEDSGAEAEGDCGESVEGRGRQEWKGSSTRHRVRRETEAGLGGTGGGVSAA